MANIPQKKIVNLPKEIRNEIQHGLLLHGKVKLVGLGIFEVKKVSSRMVHNINSGEVVKMPAYKKIQFRPTAALKEKIA